MKKLLSVFFFWAFCLPQYSVADEGMWLPMFIKKLNIADMQKKGLKLTAEEIYSINNSSLKDAIKRFLSLTDQQKEKMVNKTYEYVKNNFDRNKILTVYRSSLEYI